MTSKFKNSNGLLPDEFLDTFGREFCKYEVLWKPNPNSNEFEIQTATHLAYRKLAQALNLTVEAVLELLETFPAACVDLTNRYEMCSRTDAGCSVPDWLRPLARHFRFLDSSIECNKSEEVARYDLVRALYESARAGLAGDPMRPAGVTGGGPAGVTGRGPTRVTDNDTDDDESPLRGPRAVAHFVARHRVREEQILPVWRSVLHLCVLKLCALLVAGGRAGSVPAALRPAAAERALADLVLLHDHRVSQINILTPANLRTLVLLFQLIVAAKETYDREERRTRDEVRDEIVPTEGVGSGERDGPDGPKGYENIPSRYDREERCETRAGDAANVASHMIAVRDEPTEDKDSDRGTGTTCTSDRLNSTLAESLRYVGPCSGQILLKERPFECEPQRDRREADDVSDATEEISSDNELHTELDLEPDIHVVCNDKSDYDISNKYSKNYVKDSGNNIMNKSDVRSSAERKPDISEKSQNPDTGSENQTLYWYAENKSNSSEEQRIVWALVYTDFIKRGRSASLISLQHRWMELLHRARVALLTAWRSDTVAHRNVHPLLLVVAYRFPEIVTESLHPWKKLVLERQIVMESDIKHIVNKYLANDKVLLNITENLTYPDLLKKYVKHVNDPHCQSESNMEHCPIPKETTCNTIDSIDKLLEQEIQAQCTSVNNELDVNNTISTVLDQIDPSKATVSIIFDEDSDENVEDDCSMNMREAASDLNNVHVWNGERRPTSLTEDNKQIACTLQECKINTDFTMKTVDKEMEDKLNYMNSPVKPRSHLCVRNNHTDLNKNITNRNEPLEDQQTVSRDCRPQDDLGSLRPCKSVIDAKLVNISRVLVTPIEYLPEWKKHSRNGVIKCRNFSVKNFTKLVTLDSNRLSKCTPYIDSNKNENENYMKNEVRIKFENDNVEMDFGFGDSDINNGIVYQKYIELYGMPDHARKNRIRLTKLLKLSRTYFSLNFWSLDRNIDLMKLCKPMTIQLSKGLPRVAKRVELSDINEVRRMNRSILTAQVSPTVDRTSPPQAGRSSASHEAITTSRRTNNSVCSALDSSQLLRLLTNYAIRTKISKSVTEPVTKDFTANSNLMDSIIDTMRLENVKNIQNTTIAPTFNSLQQRLFPSSDPPAMLIDFSHTNSDTNISATDTCTRTHDIQRATEQLRNNHKMSPNNNCLPVATVSQIHISSDCTKELYNKHLQKINNIKTSIDLEEMKMPNVRELKDMILLLVKRFDNKMRHEYNMKLNRCSLNLHFKNFENQQRSLVKNISKLTKILPQYVLMESKGRVTTKETAAKKRNKINRNKCEQSKQHSNIPGGKTDNIIDIDTHTSSVLDDDCEPNLIIDERSPEMSDNIDLNSSQINKINSSKSTQETCKIRKKDKFKKKIKRVRNRSKQSKKKPEEEEKPMLNEYQEWQRQKTMALKYFTIPMTDTSKLTPKDKVAQQQSTNFSTEQQSNGCQTNISMKRKNTEEVATTSTSSDITKRSKSFPNEREKKRESDVVYISDTSSDDEVVITGCYTAEDSATIETNTNKDNTNTTQPDIHQIDETEHRNNSVLLIDTSLKQTADQNITSTPAVAVLQPVYLIINDTQQPTATREAITTTQDTETINNPLVFQVISNATPFPALKQLVPLNTTRKIPNVAMKDSSERVFSSSHTLSCQKPFNNQCKCIKCQKTPKPADVSTYSVNSIQNVSSQDTRNNEPSTSLPNQNECPVEEVISVMDYLSSTRKLTALIKVNGSNNLLFFCSKYLILTDLNIPSNNATYRTTLKIDKYKLLSQVLLPTNRKGNILLLGPKKDSDYIYCKCVKETSAKCKLCPHMNVDLPNPKNFLKIDSDYYKKICSKPIKYVRVNEKELKSNSRDVLEGNPDLILISGMFFKKLTDSPPTYVRILSALPDAATLRHLVRRKVVLYAFDVTQTHNVQAPLAYTHTDGHVTVHHTDQHLVRGMQRFLN